MPDYNTVVLVDKLSYVEKIEELISDVSKFQKIQFDPKHKENKEVRYLCSMQNNIKLRFEGLLDGGYLSKEEYKFILPVGSNPGILYGLCKVHKETDGEIPPFRPILSAIGTCSYNLSKYFVPILKEYTNNQYTINDSFSLAEDIKKQDASLFMASFDVKSLFTNIPLEETIELCVNKLYHRKRKVKGFI